MVMSAYYKNSQWSRWKNADLILLQLIQLSYEVNIHETKLKRACMQELYLQIYKKQYKGKYEKFVNE